MKMHPPVWTFQMYLPTVQTASASVWARLRSAKPERLQEQRQNLGRRPALRLLMLAALVVEVLEEASGVLRLRLNPGRQVPSLWRLRPPCLHHLPCRWGGWQRGYTYVQLGDLGWMCFNQSNINAHCSIHSCFSQKCHADRVRFPHVGPGASRAGQGRPLGFLMLWLQRAADYDNHSSRQCKIALGSAAWHQERVSARQALAQIEGADMLFAAERPLRPDEEQEEPLIVPG